MSESAIRQQIYTILSDVTNIGKVYDYERWAVDWNTFINLFKTTINGKDQIRGAEIGRMAPVSDDMHRTIRNHTYFINLFMGVNDAEASEKTFNAIIEAIATAFRPDEQLALNGECLGIEYIKVDELDTRTFGSVLCHFCRMTTMVYEHLA